MVKQHIDKIKLIFVHIPKTGGTFIERNLQKLATKYGERKKFSSHYSINSYSEFKGYVSFTVVLNPYDRLFSAYKYMTKQHGKPFKKTMDCLGTPSNFEEFVNSLYDIHQKK